MKQAKAWINAHCWFIRTEQTPIPRFLMLLIREQCLHVLAAFFFFSSVGGIVNEKMLVASNSSLEEEDQSSLLLLILENLSHSLQWGLLCF